MKHVIARLGNMRKAQSFCVYPESKTAGDEEERFLIQSDKRICSIWPAKGKGLLSKHCGSGAYQIHLCGAMGPTVVDIPADLIAEIRAAQPKSGDEIGPGVYVA